MAFNFLKYFRVYPTKAYFFVFHNKTTSDRVSFNNKTLFDRIDRIDRIVCRSLRKSDMKDSSALRRVNVGEVQTLQAIKSLFYLCQRR